MQTTTSCKAVLVIGGLAVLFFASITGGTPKGAKMKPEELVAKHLASIGTQEALAAAQTRAIGGTAQVIFRLGGQGQLNGKANFLSQGRMVRIGMNFPALEYPAEQFAFDGSKVTVAQIRPGERSNLAAFLYHYDILLKEGLLGGTSTTAWALLDVSGRQAKLDYTGLKKFEGQQLHELKYRAKKGAGDVQIYLYFEPETFRHLFSQYRLVQPASMVGTPTESPGQRDTIYTLVEYFGDFQTVDNLTLPHSYKLVMTVEGQRQTFLAEWNVTVQQLVHNQEIESKYFRVQ